MSMSTRHKNSVKSGPGPLKIIYEKISALENEVSGLKAELRLVKRKLQNCEQSHHSHSVGGSSSVQNAIVDQIKDSQFSVHVTLTPTAVSDDFIKIVQPPVPVPTSPYRNRSPSKNAKNITISKQIFDHDLSQSQMEPEAIEHDVQLVLDPVFDPEDNREDVDLKNFEYGCGETTENGDGTGGEFFQMESEYVLPGSDSEQNLKILRSSYTNFPQSKPGREVKPIWNYYQVSIGPDKKKIAICKNCGTKVSPKAVRLKHHLAKNCKTKKK